MRKKPKKAHADVSRDDIAYMRHLSFGFSPAEAHSAARCRAAAGELVRVSKPTSVGINAVLSGVPEATIRDFCRQQLRTT